MFESRTLVVEGPRCQEGRTKTLLVLLLRNASAMNDLAQSRVQSLREPKTVTNKRSSSWSVPSDRLPGAAHRPPGLSAG